MTFTRHTAWLGLLLASLLCACERSPRPALPSTLPAVAMLNGEPVSRALLDHLTRAHTGVANPNDAPASAAAEASAAAVDRKQLLDELIDIELLAQKARQRGLDKSPAVVTEVELQSKTLLAQRVVRELMGSTPISDAELQVVHAKVQAQQQRWREQAQIQLSTDAALPAGVVAIVNGQPVQRTVLNLLAQTRRGDAPADAPQDHARLLDDLVMTELLSQSAHATGLAAGVDTQAEMELALKSLLGQHLMRQLVSEVTVSDEALHARYTHTQPELEITASHILLGDETMARQVITELDAGASFAALAKKHTADEYTRDKGGRLGAVKGADLEPAFVATARSLKPGGITPTPVRTVHGWHVIQLHTMRILDKDPFEAMKPALRSQLVNERVQAQVAQWRKEARLEILRAP